MNLGVENATPIIEKLSTEQQEVLTAITEELLTVKQISIVRKTSYQAVYKIKNKLIKKGYLTRNVRGLKNSTPTKPLKPPKRLKHGIRLHGQQFRIKILNKTNKYDNLLSDKNIFYLDNNTIQLYKDSINISCEETRSFLGFDEFKATALSFNYWNTIFTRLETRLNIILIKGENTRIKQTNCHYANINNEIAKDCNEKKVKIKIFAREDGKCWFEIDNSWNLNEAETKHPTTALDDMTQFRTFVNDLRDKRPKLMISDLNNIVRENAESIRGLIQTQEYMAENVKSHIDSIRTLGTATKNLSTEVSKMNGINLINSINSVKDVFRREKEITELSQKEKDLLTERLLNLNV